MDSELIDLIYQNEEVEGVAIFDGNNQLVENQLSITLVKVMAIAETLHNLRSSLMQAGREMLGFLIKSDKSLLHVTMFPNMLIVLELSKVSSVNALDKKIRSVVGTGQVATNTPVQPSLPAAKKPVALPAAQPAQSSQPLQPVATSQPVIADGIDFVDFKFSLSKLLKTIAPGKVADGMINSAMKDMGIEPDTVQLAQPTATKLGYKVIEKIPNKARRKIIENEYKTLIGNG